MPYAVLAVPIVVGIVALRGLTVALPMFHGSDEFNYHLPTILRFGRELPFPDLARYRAAQTPLFQLLLAYVGKLVGYELWRLRLVEAAISYGVGVAAFELLHRRIGLARLPAVALALALLLSPYVLAASFRLLTDNLALLCALLCLERLEAYRQRGGDLAAFCGAAAWAGLALLTRQSSAFLFGVAGLYALSPRPAVAPARRLAALGALVLAALPAGLLFLTWHGLTPPGGDPTSCGLCGGGAGGSGGAGLRAATLELTLAALGAYGIVLFAPVLASPAARGEWRRYGRRALAGAALGAVLVLAFPMRPDLRATGARTTAGLLWNAARHGPAVAGTPLLFWLLVPLAGAVLAWRLAVTPRRLASYAVLGCFLAGSLVVRLAWQKYVDPYALLILLLTVRPTELAGARRLAGAAVLAVGSIAYALSFVV